MINRIRFFIKGAHVSIDLVLIATIWALAEKNTRLEKELQDLKDSSKSNYMSYYKKHLKSGVISPEKPSYPIGFASVIDTPRDSDD